MEKTRYTPGVIIKCLEDIFSVIVPSIRWYTEGKEYVIQDDYTIIEDTGDKIPFLESALFKRRAFKRMIPRYFIVTCMYQISPTNCTTATASVIKDNGKYINNKELIAQLRKINKTSDTIIITNIIELSKEDYEEYNRK